MRSQFLSFTFLAALLTFSGCGIFLVNELNRSTADKMKNYVSKGDGRWEIVSVHWFTSFRGHTSDPYVTQEDSLWYPGGEIQFIDTPKRKDRRYNEAHYTDANGNSIEIDWTISGDGDDDDDPKLSFYGWDNFPFPKTVGGFWLDEWENDRLVLLNDNRGQDTYTQERLTIELKRK